MKRFGGTIILIMLVGGCFTAEIMGLRRLTPSGRASTLREYLAWQLASDQFAVIDINNITHVMAYGPESSWLGLSSGPSAYVFDGSGRLVDWSTDIGDDPKFDKRWSAQRLREAGRSLSRNEVARIAATRAGG